MTSIKDDVRNWSAAVLEVPNSHLPNEMPACPYAKSAWDDNKVEVYEVERILDGTVREADRFHNHKNELVVVASYNLPDPDEFLESMDLLNNIYSHRDIHIMVFHPSYGAEEAELDFLYDHDWESEIDREYCMVFIQKLSQVDAASRKLEKLGYYKAFSEDEFFNLVIERRRRLSWR